MMIPSDIRTWTEQAESGKSRKQFLFLNQSRYKKPVLSLSRDQSPVNNERIMTIPSESGMMGHMYTTKTKIGNIVFPNEVTKRTNLQEIDDQISANAMIALHENYSQQRSNLQTPQMNQSPDFVKIYQNQNYRNSRYQNRPTPTGNNNYSTNSNSNNNNSINSGAQTNQQQSILYGGSVYHNNQNIHAQPSIQRNPAANIFPQQMSAQNNSTNNGFDLPGINTPTNNLRESSLIQSKNRNQVSGLSQYKKRGNLLQNIRLKTLDNDGGYQRQNNFIENSKNLITLDESDLMNQYKNQFKNQKFQNKQQGSRPHSNFPINNLWTPTNDIYGGNSEMKSIVFDSKQSKKFSPPRLKSQNVVHNHTPSIPNNPYSTQNSNYSQNQQPLQQQQYHLRTHSTNTNNSKQSPISILSGNGNISNNINNIKGPNGTNSISNNSRAASPYMYFQEIYKPKVNSVMSKELSKDLESDESKFQKDPLNINSQEINLKEKLEMRNKVQSLHSNNQSTQGNNGNMLNNFNNNYQLSQEVKQQIPNPNISTNHNTSLNDQSLGNASVNFNMNQSKYSQDFRETQSQDLSQGAGGAESQNNHQIYLEESSNNVISVIGTNSGSNNNTNNQNNRVSDKREQENKSPSPSQRNTPTKLQVASVKKQQVHPKILWDMSDDEWKNFGDRFPKNLKKQKLLGRGGFALVWLGENKENKEQIYAVKQILTNNTHQTHIKQIWFGSFFFEKGVPQAEYTKYQGIQNLSRLISFDIRAQDSWLFYELCGDSLGTALYDIRTDDDDPEGKTYKMYYQDLYLGMRKDTRLLKQLIYELSQALYLLSDHRIVHSDLKTENILLKTEIDQKGEIQLSSVQLIDYGSSFTFGNLKHFCMATPEYMAPEILNYILQQNNLTYIPKLLQFLENYENPHVIDVWSLGCVVLEIINGLPLWMSLKTRIDLKNDSVIKTGLFAVKGRVFESIMKKQILVIQVLDQVIEQENFSGVVIDNDIKYLIKRMLHIDPSKRISPKEIIDFLQDQLGGNQRKDGQNE